MFDMVKGLFIVVMMLGHTLTDYYPPWVIRNDGTWIGLAYDMLYRLLCCGMIPMFCIICGYGFRQKPMGKCLRGQVRFLWKPYVWMTLAITAGNDVISIPSGTGSAAVPITAVSGLTANDAGRVITLLGTGTEKLATIADGTTFVLAGGSTWTAKAGSKISFQVLDASTLVEVLGSRVQTA